MQIKIPTLSPGFKKYFLNTGWLFVDKVVRMLVALFVGVYVARYLGPERFGILSYAGSFVGLFTAFASLGLNGIVVRNLVQDEEQRDLILGTAFCLKTFGAIVMFCMVMVACQFTSSDFYTKSIIAIIAAGVLLDSFQVVDFHFQSKVQAKFCALSSLFAMIISSILKLILIFLAADLIWFAVVTVIEKGVLGIGYLIFYLRQKLKLRDWRFSIKTAQDLLKDSWPLILSGFVIMIYMRIDQIMIKEMLGDAAVGQYAAATRLSEVWYFIPMVICSSLFPAILNAKEKNAIVYYQRLQSLYDMMFVISFLIALFVSFSGAWVVDTLYGSAYQEAANVLVLHIWAGIFVFLGVSSGRWLLVENMQIFAFYRTLLGACANLGLNFLLIPRYGICGAAFSTIIAQAIASYLGYATNKKTLKIFIMLTKAILSPIRYIINF